MQVDNYLLSRDSLKMYLYEIIPYLCLLSLFLMLAIVPLPCIIGRPGKFIKTCFIFKSGFCQMSMTCSLKDCQRTWSGLQVTEI